MTNEIVEENYDKTVLYVDHMNVCVEISEYEVTGRGYDEKRDEYHESTQTTHSEEKFIECPLVELTNKETGETVSDDIIESIQEDGLRDVRRVDYDKVEFDYDGETYVGVYDMSNLPEMG